MVGGLGAWWWIDEAMRRCGGAAMRLCGGAVLLLLVLVASALTGAVS